MGSSNETNKALGSQAKKLGNNHIATSSKNGDQKQSPKKKKPIQHLLAGGGAGFVESSVCHPLDTIKTRMQLRRTSTLKRRALGSSLHEATGREPRGIARKATVNLKKNIGSTGRKSNAVESCAVKNDNVVHAKPDFSKGKAVASTGTITHHDVGWKQRLPPGSSAAGETTSKIAAVKPSTPANNVVVAPLGPFGTGRRIVQREGPMALYKGLTAVYTGIVPKMAIRFVSFEYYREKLGDWHGQYFNTQATYTSATPQQHPPTVTFLAGLFAGLTEAVAIVTPAEVCKIRMQSQYHSLLDPSQALHAKYKNVAQTAALVVREEGIGALYKGVVPTMLRQGCNQAVNFTAYNWSKKQLLAWKGKKQEEGTTPGGGRSAVAKSDLQLDHWQTLLLGGISGGMGPLVNNPLDVVKTRMQKQVISPGKEPKYKSLLQSCVVIAKEEGIPALWKGITPRLMRIMPGQAITFMTYEAVSAQMDKYGLFD